MSRAFHLVAAQASPTAGTSVTLKFVRLQHMKICYQTYRLASRLVLVDLFRIYRYGLGMRLATAPTRLNKTRLHFAHDANYANLYFFSRWAVSALNSSRPKYWNTQDPQVYQRKCNSELVLKTAFVCGDQIKRSPMISHRCLFWIMNSRFSLTIAVLYLLIRKWWHQKS